MPGAATLLNFCEALVKSRNAIKRLLIFLGAFKQVIKSNRSVCADAVLFVRHAPVSRLGPDQPGNLISGLLSY